MVGVLVSSAVGREFPSGYTKDFEVVICWFSAIHAVLRSKSQFGHRIRIICASEATYLSEDCCFSELSL